MWAQNLPETPFSILMSDKRKSGVKEIDTGLMGQKLGQPGAKFLHDVSSAQLYCGLT